MTEDHNKLPIDEPGVPDGPADDGVQTVPVEDVAAAASPEPGVPNYTGPPDGPGEPPNDRLVPILIVATVVLLVTTILFGLMAFAPALAPFRSGATKLAVQAQAEQEITEVAKRFAKNFLTINYKTIDADFKRVSADATGKFRDQLGQVLKLSKAEFTKAKATSSGAITETFVLRHEKETAIVRVVAQRTISNSKRKKESGTQVLDITLVNTTDGWKADNVDQLGAEAAR